MVNCFGFDYELAVVERSTSHTVAGHAEHGRFLL
jgi:hypothetical protein